MPPPDYLEKMQRAIVGVALEVQRWEGVWKVSQNRTDEDRAGVVQGLRPKAPAPPKTWRPWCWDSRWAEVCGEVAIESIAASA